MTWNTPKPQEWKSEELSQDALLTTKLLTSSMAKGCVTHFMSLAVCFIARDVIMLPPGPLRQGCPILKNLRNKSCRT